MKSVKNPFAKIKKKYGNIQKQKLAANSVSVRKENLAIEATGNNKKKLKAVLRDLAYLTDGEMKEIFESLKPEKKESQQEAIEQIKVKLISLKIMQHIIQDKNIWHLEELTDSIKDSGKLSVIDFLFHTIQDYEQNGKLSVDFDLKSKIMVTLLNLTNHSYSQKIEIVNTYKEEKVLKEEEGDKIAQRIAAEEVFKKVADKKEQEIEAVLEKLPEYSKIAIISYLLEIMKKSEERKKPVVDFLTKTRLVKTLFDINNIEDEKKISLLDDRYTKNGYLTLEEKSEIKKMIIIDKMMKDLEEHDTQWDWEKYASQLTEKSKMEIPKDGIIRMRNYETENGTQIDFATKVKLINKMFHLTEGNYQLKADAITRYEQSKILETRVANEVLEDLMDEALKDSKVEQATIGSRET